jgi:hypothetical protein
VASPLDSANRWVPCSYRVAIAPEPNSSRLTSFKSIRFDCPANNVGPPAWAAPRTCTHRSLPAPPTPAGGATHEQSLTRLPLELLNGLAQISAHELRVPIAPLQVLDTTYFLAASIVGRRVPSNQASVPLAPAAATLPPSFRKSPGQRGGHRPGGGSQPRDGASLRPPYCRWSCR